MILHNFFKIKKIFLLKKIKTRLFNQASFIKIKIDIRKDIKIF